MLIVVYFYIVESPKVYLKDKDYEQYLLSLLEISVFNDRKQKFLKYLITHSELTIIEIYLSKKSNNAEVYSKISKILTNDDIRYLQSIYNRLESKTYQTNVNRNNDDKLDKNVVNNNNNFNNEDNEEKNVDENNDNEDGNLSDTSINRRKKLDNELNFEKKSKKVRNNSILSAQTIPFLDDNGKEAELLRVDFDFVKKFFKYKRNCKYSESILSSKNIYSEKEDIVDMKLITDVENSNNDHNSSNNELIDNKKDLDSYGILAFFKYPSIRWKFLNLNLIWLVGAGVYFGNTINIKNLPGNILSNSLINAAIEFLGIILSLILMNTKLFGRVRSNILYFLISFIGYMIMTTVDLSDTLRTIISFVVKLVLASYINTMFVICGESYPNPIKEYGYGINIALGKFGAMIMTFLIELMTDFQVNLVFTIGSIITMVLFFFVKETRGLPLESDIEELLEESTDK